MSCPGFRIWLLLLGALSVPGVQFVSCIEIFTPGELEAINGTHVKLKCTFTSSAPVSLQSVTVSWYFRPLIPGPDESVFYYDKEPYPPDQGRFRDHAVWSGDIMRKDASITLQDIPPTFNGTYICQVRNRPDVHGSNGEISLRVVQKVSLSEISMLAIAVGAGIALILLILGVVLAVKLCRRRDTDRDIEMHPPEEQWKDPTACKPEEAVHLYVASKAKEAASSDDDDEFEESSGGDDEEEEEEEEDDDDDDEDDDDDDDDDE